MIGFDPGTARKMDAANWLFITGVMIMLAAQLVRAGWI